MQEQTRKMIISDLEGANESIKRVQDILIGEVDLHDGSLLISAADNLAEVITNLKMRKIAGGEDE